MLTLRSADDAPAVLQQLADEGELHLFEVVKPSLHDVFIQIAKPDSMELATQ